MRIEPRNSCNTEHTIHTLNMYGTFYVLTDPY